MGDDKAGDKQAQHTRNPGQAGTDMAHQCLKAALKRGLPGRCLCLSRHGDEHAPLRPTGKGLGHTALKFISMSFRTPSEASR
jgi:hypothetical protein